MAASRTPERFYSLDVLRGVAALIVAVYHYRHFAGPPDFPIDGLPLQFALKQIYFLGFLAVDLFFVLSGFIFFCFYSEKIGTGRVSGWRFFVLRFSRLYPLHIATMLLAIVLGSIYVATHGRQFVYDGDVVEFVKSLFLVNYWAPGSQVSFNGPSWSISIEALLYLCFFFWARGPSRPAWLLLPIACGLAVGLWQRGQHFEVVGYAFASFYSGGLAYHAWKRVGALDLMRWAGACLLVLIAAYFAHRRLPFHIFRASLTVAFFPLLVFLLALRPNLGRRIHLFGDASYSIYMLHYPVQITFALLYPGSFFVPQALIFYTVCVIGVAMASFRYFERPAQTWLRANLTALPHPARVGQPQSATTPYLPRTQQPSSDRG